MANKGKAESKAETGANLGFEAKLWQMADGTRCNPSSYVASCVLRLQTTN